MSSASLALPRTDTPAHRPDGTRISALSLAITVNLAVLLVALRPLPPAAFPVAHEAPPIQVRTIRNPMLPPLPPAIDVKPLPPTVTTPVPVHHTVAPPIHVSAPPVIEEGAIAVPPITQPSIEPAQAGVAENAVQANLAYRVAPLRFPPVAIRQHMHGTVLLRVLVDSSGRPQQVQIEKSSGYGLLDRSAREQVLKSWQFEPAMVGGRRVPAWARVPVNFDLRQL